MRIESSSRQWEVRLCLTSLENVLSASLSVHAGLEDVSARPAAALLAVQAVRPACSAAGPVGRPEDRGDGGTNMVVKL